MDVGADAAGQVISLAGQVFKIGMEGMVVVVKIAGKGAAHAAALLAAALSGKKKTKGKVMLKNMLKDSKSLTLFTIREKDLAGFAKEAKAYNVRYCIVKDKKAKDGNIDMFIRAEDAAVVSRIIERHGLSAVRQDVSVASAPEAEGGALYEEESYAYGDVTISREINSLVDEAGETDTQIKTRVPGTFGKNARYVYFDKAGLEEVHGGKSYKVHIDPEGRYDLYDEGGAVAKSVSGEELLTHYDKKDHEREPVPGNSKARTASEARSGKNYSEQAGSDAKETGTRYVAFESYYCYSGGDEEHLYDERCRLLGIDGNGEINAYPGHEGFFLNEGELNAFLKENPDLKYVSREALEDIAAGKFPEEEKEHGSGSPQAEESVKIPEAEKEAGAAAPEAGRAGNKRHTVSEKTSGYAYGDVTISKASNSLVKEETDTQIRTRVPGTYGRDVRYVNFDKAGLEEIHGGKSYKTHIDPKGKYDLYDAGGAVAETVSGEELLTHYDRKDQEARSVGETGSGKETEAVRKAGTGKEADSQRAKVGAGSEKTVRAAQSAASHTPTSKNRFNNFSQRTYDFDELEKEMLKDSLQKAPEREIHAEPEPHAAMAKEENPKLPSPPSAVTEDRTPSEREDGYSQTSYNPNFLKYLEKNGMSAPALAEPSLPVRTEEELRPSVREKLSGYKKEEQEGEMERQIRAAEEKRERETRRLEREGGDVLPEQREKIGEYTGKRDAAMADFLSDAKLPEEVR